MNTRSDLARRIVRSCVAALLGLLSHVKTVPLAAAVLLLVAAGALGPRDSLAADRQAQPAESRAITIALVQFNSMSERTQDNYDQMDRLTRSAVKRGARWVMFHEVCLTDYRVPETIPDGPSCKRMMGLARTLNCFISFGMAERDKENVYIAQVFIGPEGLVYRYRKTWLWRPGGEWRWYDPGTGPKRFQIDGIDATCFICSDGVSGRCIERARRLKPAVVFYPNNRPGQLPHSEFGAWAKTIGAPMLLTNRSGRGFIGGSAVFDANGKILAAANRDGKEEILYYTLTLPAAEDRK